jgi:hypothetical protein
MPKYGGPGTLRQPCVKRVCEQMQKEDREMKQARARTNPAAAGSAVTAAVALAAPLAAARGCAASAAGGREGAAAKSGEGYAIEDVD